MCRRARTSIIILITVRETDGKAGSGVDAIHEFPEWTTDNFSAIKYAICVMVVMEAG